MLYKCGDLQQLPESIGQLAALQRLCGLAECTSLIGLPESIGELIELTCLNLNVCSELEVLPDSTALAGWSRCSTCT